MARPLSPLALALLPIVVTAGCKGDEDTSEPTLDPIDGAATGVWVGQGLGVGTVEVPVFATNAVGAPVGGQTVAVSSSGALASDSVATDATGWGAAVVDGARGAWTVDATLGGATASGTAWSVDARMGTFGAAAWPVTGSASAAAVAGRGVAWAAGDTIWWAAPGGVPVRVAQPGGEILAMIPCHVDADGETDLLAWTASQVLLLRGRDGGGLYWGAGWSVADATVTGVSVADHDGDAYADLAVALVSAEGTTRIEMFVGDGVWGFAYDDLLELAFPIHGLSVEDLDGDGEHEITVLTEDGLLRRFALLDGEWSSTTTSTEYDLAIGAGSVLLPSTDLDADGVEDVVASGPLLDGSGWQVYVVTIGGSAATVYTMFAGDETYPIPAYAGLAVADFTGDGLADLAMSTPDGRVHRTAWYQAADDTAAMFHMQTFSMLPAGPIGAGDLTGDGVPEVAVADAWVTLLEGKRVADDPATEADEEVLWMPTTPDSATYGLDVVLDPWVGDATGDGVVDVVAAVAGAEGLAIQGWTGIPASDTAEEHLTNAGAALLSATGTALDFAVCDGRAFVLVQEADGGVRLYRADLGANAGPTLVGDALDVDGDLLACGAFADGEVAVVSGTGAVAYVAADGTSVQGAAVDPGAADAVAADPDGDGVAGLLVCAEEGCSVLAGDLDGDGIDDTVVATAAGIEATLGGAVSVVDAAGPARLSDADGDGVLDLVVGDLGAVLVHPGVPGAVGPATARYFWRQVAGPALFGDLSGDGLPDTFVLGEDRAEVEEPIWTGAVVYARATAQE